MFEKTEWYFAVLAALLIAAVYYVGVRTDLQTFDAFINHTLNTITGRDAQGRFQGVPQQ